MTTSYRLRVQGKHQIVGIYAPHSDITPLVRVLLGWGEHLEFDGTAKGMLATLFLQMGYTLTEADLLLNGKSDSTPFGVLGTDVLDALISAMRQNIAPDIWLQTLDKRLSMSKRKQVFVTGMTYPNEYHWVKWAGGYTVAVINPTYPNTHRLHNYQFDSILLDEGTDYEFVKACRELQKTIACHFGEIIV